MYRDIYVQEKELLGKQVRLTGKIRRSIRLHSRRSMVERWNNHLSDPNTTGQRSVGAIQPCLETWLDRAQGEVTYRLTQVLSGHGCFGEYLCRIGKERITIAGEAETRRNIRWPNVRLGTLSAML